MGQGLAVIVTTATHTLVYDTGARFSGRFDAGRDLLVPLLKNQRRRVIDRLVISHGDNDYAGGLPGLLAEMRVKHIDSGTRQQFGADIRPAVSACNSGERWHWDGILFEYVQRPPKPAANDNNRSCVLRIGGSSGLLLPGDLEKSGELQLLNHLEQSHQLQRLQAQVMLVPHHGSQNASTRTLINAVDPQLAVVSSGYANRFGHPHPRVIERYQVAEVILVSTATVGAVNLEFDGSGLLRWSAQRIDHPRYWH